ncbi:hypothetical protein LCGC14_2955740 [marine sediment metagenome]|uniref:PABS domain-containing protein n=1 Tax=marine sediment metagenome TaxID=412755 RepID=A0A0F8ZLI1_9ZZZZ
MTPSQPWYAKYKVDVPVPQTRGDWMIAHFDVSREGSALAAFRDGGRAPCPGTYTGLEHRGQVIMSDTPAEICDHLLFIHQARGDVLITGLGLGVIVKACLAKDTVTSVTVIEKSPDVIAMVGPHYACARFQIIEADALVWRPPRGLKWTCAWHDIWANICTDNLAEMTQLHRRYGRRVEFQGSWCKDLLLRRRRQEKRWAR